MLLPAHPRNVRVVRAPHTILQALTAAPALPGGCRPWGAAAASSSATPPRLQRSATCPSGWGFDRRATLGKRARYVHEGATTAWCHKRLALAGHTPTGWWDRYGLDGLTLGMDSPVCQRSVQALIDLKCGASLVGWTRGAAKGWWSAPIPAQPAAVAAQCRTGCPGTSAGLPGPP